MSKWISVKNVFDMQIGENVLLRGWIRTVRHSKGFSFIELNDGTCLKNIQIIADNTLKNYTSTIEKLTTGSSIEVEGIVVESPGKGQRIEIKAQRINVFSIAPTDYPLQKKRHSFEFLRTIAHLRARTNTFGAVARIRSALAYSVHKFFIERDFFYVNTPIITTSDCEGAGEMFQVTTIDMNKPPLDKNGKVDFSKDFFSRPAYLTVSGQMEGETYALALGKIYTFGPTFRAENSHTTRHLSEFWMIEPEAAFYELEDDMNLAEEFVKYCISYVLDNCKEDMEFFNSRIEPGLIDMLRNVVDSSFEKISYTTAIDILKKNNDKFEYKAEWGCDIQTEHEKYLTEEYFKKPVIVYEYPKDIKAFYMKQNDDGKTVAAMDVLVPSIGELIGGSEREWDYDKLVNRIKELNMNVEDYSWYLDMRKFGSVPHSGFGLGFDRFVQFITGMKNIKDVIPYPRFPGNAEF